METQQPNWQLIVNLGDVQPIDHDGYFVYRDTTSGYTEEAEKLFANYDIDGQDTWTVYRIILDRLKEARDSAGQVYLVPLRFDETRPHPVSHYDEWFHRDLAKVADFAGTTTQEMRDMLCSDDAIKRAIAYENIYAYHGWENGDSYPLIFNTREEVEARYAKRNGGQA